MLEQRHPSLAPLSVFFAHFAANFAVGVIAIALALGIGMIGYHHFESMSWTDAFVNAAMILSGMGPVASLHTDAGKLFAGFYALFSGLAFITIMAIIFAPVIQRFLHKFHLMHTK